MESLFREIKEEFWVEEAVKPLLEELRSTLNGYLKQHNMNPNRCNCCEIGGLMEDIYSFAEIATICYDDYDNCSVAQVKLVRDNTSFLRHCARLMACDPCDEAKLGPKNSAPGFGF